MRQPSIIPDKLIGRNGMPIGTTLIPLDIPNYDTLVHCWVAESTVSAFKSGQAVSPFKPPSKKRYKNITGGPVLMQDGFPVNPFGLTGRNCNLGQLWQWGPSFAADSVVMRLTKAGWEVLLITRHENKRLALIGGFNDEGESLEKTVLREFKEELGVDISHLRGRRIFAGPVDDDRNGDHSWMETAAFRYIVDYAESLQFEFKPQRGEVDKAEWYSAQWAARQKLHAGHQRIVSLALKSVA